MEAPNSSPTIPNAAKARAAPRSAAAGRKPARHRTDAPRNVQESLKALLEVTLELAETNSLDELYRKAVELGTARLGFERLSIWLQHDDQTCAGTYGIDERGALRDERSCSRPIGPGERKLLAHKQPGLPVAVTRGALMDHQQRPVGAGIRARCALWDGGKVIGFLHADNLFRGRPLKRSDLEVLSLYASGLGHLCAVKRAESSLRASEERMERLTHALPIVLFSVDPKTGKYLLLRGAVKALLGRDPEKLVADIAADASAIHPADWPRVCERYEAGVAAMEPFELEFRVQKEDGSAYVWLQERIAPILGPDGALLRLDGVLLDITQDKKAEHEREQMQLQLFNAQKLKSLGVLVGGITHDFSNLLTIIAGNAHLLQQTQNLTADQLRSLMDIEAAARQATEMAKSLQSFSKPPKPEVRRVEVNRLVTEMHRLIRRLYPTTIEFQLDLTEEIGAIAADPGQIQQVLVNLSVNARDAMPTGGTLKIQTRVVGRDQLPPGVDRREAEPRYVRVRVKDTGSGMDEATLRQAFDPFFTTKPKDHGTGLGLAIVHKIVTAHDGFIDMKSRPGKGTQVDLFLPALEPSASPPELSDPPLGQGKERIIVVEDEEMVASLLKTALEGRGYRVTVAYDPETAIRLAEQPGNTFELGILDYSMPKLTGDKCLVQIRRVQPGMRVLLITGHGLSLEELCTQDLFLLKKPFPLPLLMRTVREILDGEKKRLASGGQPFPEKPAIAE